MIIDEKSEKDNFFLFRAHVEFCWEKKLSFSADYVIIIL